MGAAMVMVMPPYHGATFRFGEAQVRAFYQGVSDRIGIPIMIQDARPPAAAVARLPGRHGARDRAGLVLQDGNGRRRRQAARADRAGRRGGRGPWDGEEAITLLADLEAGVTGSMTGGGYADGIRPIIEAHRRGDVEGLRAVPALAAADQPREPPGRLPGRQGVDEGGRGDRLRRPRAPWPLHPETRRQLLAIARRLDPLVLRWGVERKRRAGGAGRSAAARPVLAARHWPAAANIAFRSR